MNQQIQRIKEEEEIMFKKQDELLNKTIYRRN